MYKGAVDLRDNFEEKSDEVKEAIDVCFVNYQERKYFLCQFAHIFSSFLSTLGLTRKWI